MLDAIRTLALDYLYVNLQNDKPPENLEVWYQALRKDSLGKLFPFLVEDTGKVEKFFVIRKEEGSEFSEVQVRDITRDNSPYLPFVKPTGSQDAQIGPVIKRNYSNQKGASPSVKILNTTVKYFIKLSESDKSWAAYFKEIVAILNTVKIKLPDGTTFEREKIKLPNDTMIEIYKTKGKLESGENGTDRTEDTTIENNEIKIYESLLECVVQEIGEIRDTVIITVEDAQNKLPGQHPEYLKYLMTEKLAGDRYLTSDLQAVKSVCPLCSANDIDVFPNALKGAGFNILNMDRIGAFPNIDKSQAWKGFALCAACADLLYVYKYHVLKKIGPKKSRMPFTAKVAGETALIIPFCTLNAKDRHNLLNNVIRFINSIPDDVEEDEESLLNILKDEKGLLNLTFLWADIGQNIENVKGQLTDVLPSRLKELSQFNEMTNEWNHPLFPKIKLIGNNNMGADISLKALNPLFKRPGGKKARYMNESKKLFQMKGLVASAVYHKTEIWENLLWNEILLTAQWWWLEAIVKGKAYGLLYEGMGKKEKSFLTAAGWIRHLAWWLYYFRELGVLKMDGQFFMPENEILKPYFGMESGINSQEKAYAFLIGVLYGKLLEVQGARGVNVGANALTWLKRLTLRGKDIPELYVKIRGKLLAYETEKSQKVRELIQEIGKLGIKLGDSINLDEIQTNYFLLLGQSMTTTILKNEEKNKEKKK